VALLRSAREPGKASPIRGGGRTEKRTRKQERGKMSLLGRASHRGGRNGTGGSKYPNLPAEFSNVPFTRGIVDMARASDPNSANSQFFIMFADGRFLNGMDTVIGQVVSGMDVVDKIKKGNPQANGTVVDPDKMPASRSRRTSSSERSADTSGG
jgi:cyclophilin family peptidyl-prolyl cis-trans isomerase